MKIRINEVWNTKGETKELAVVECHPLSARATVWRWINNNRPDLSLATDINAHGYHAVEI